VNAKTPKGIDLGREEWTPLHVVAANTNDRVEIATLLVGKGAAVDPLDPKRMTPLHVGMLSNCPRICQYLLEKGADWLVKNNDGVDPLSHSLGAGRDYHLQSAEVIIKWAESHKK